MESTLRCRTQRSPVARRPDEVAPKQPEPAYHRRVDDNSADQLTGECPERGGRGEAAWCSCSWCALSSGARGLSNEPFAAQTGAQAWVALPSLSSSRPRAEHATAGGFRRHTNRDNAHRRAEEAERQPEASAAQKRARPTSRTARVSERARQVVWCRAARPGARSRDRAAAAHGRGRAAEWTPH